MWVKCVLVWYSQPLTSIFGLVNNSIKKIRLECCLHPSHSMRYCPYSTLIKANCQQRKKILLIFQLNCDQKSHLHLWLKCSSVAYAWLKCNWMSAKNSHAFKEYWKKSHSHHFNCTLHSENYNEIFFFKSTWNPVK